MRAGLLRERLVLQSAVGVSDGQGGTTIVSPTTVATLPAQFMAKSATELLQAESVASHAQYQFRIRSRAGVHAGLTVQWSPSWTPTLAPMTLEVLGVQPEPDLRGMLLTCVVVQ